MRAFFFVAAGLALAGCGQDSGASKETRSDAVTAAASASSKPAPTAAATAAATAEPRHGKLCSASNRVEKDLPKVKFGKIEASSTTLGDGTLETGGMWTWINLWAGWCKPCKEEFPLIAAFRDRLAKDGAAARVAFVSVDDDDREARNFLSTSAVKDSLYLPEGKDRSKFLEAIGGGTSLPTHVFVDPAGSVRCIVHGAITEADYPELAAMFGKK